ncbi:MAG TPA: hypothetical protein VNN20_08835 [Thermodesulfobacteriota bacterium]|nr:hypothetical protein [Thermodesulfobacteriota bacterium]
MKLKNAFEPILETSDTEANAGALYTTGDGAMNTGAGIPSPIPRLRNRFVSALVVMGNRINDETMSERIRRNLFILSSSFNPELVLASTSI